jgi:glucose 1-dehydrogenase
MPDKYDDNNKRKKVVVITGSGKGIGRTIATEFAKAGYYVMINDLEQEEELKHTAKEISKIIDDNNNNSNNKVAYVVGDVSEEQTAVALIEETVRRFGRIDALINNAAISEKASTTKKTTYNERPNTTFNSLYKQASPYFTLEEYEIADLYLKGAYFCIREAAKQMIITAYEEAEKQNITTKIAAGGGGAYSIINVSSPYKSIPKVKADAYTYSMSGVDPFTSSRVGIKALTKTVALQLADSGIRVNAIAPGVIATIDTINKQILEDEQEGEKRKEKEKDIPFHRIGTPEEIAKIALFLASDDASYITGSLIYADGGLSLLRSNYFLEKDIEQD